MAKTDKVPAQPSDDVPRDPYNTKPLTEAQIQPVLEALAADKSAGEAVFIAAGMTQRHIGAKSLVLALPFERAALSNSSCSSSPFNGTENPRGTPPPRIWRLLAPKRCPKDMLTSLPTSGESMDRQ